MTLRLNDKLLALLTGFMLFIGAYVNASPPVVYKGEIRGSVLNQKHLPLAKAKVALVKDNVSIVTTTADVNGDFLIPNITAGKFQIVITYGQNKKVTVNNIAVFNDKSTVLLIDVFDSRNKNKADIFIYLTPLKNPDPDFEYIDTAYKYEIPQ